ncbi:MAG: lactam utilization protein LamB [Chloroflexi bacterium]|nr:lactam utilization protein LamB [Chloroflexota bacterium]
MNKKIDFNCDMGESFGMHKLGMDEEVIKYITSANVACGFHSGDPNWMKKTVDLAIENDVEIGAHPSFNDLVGFGRRSIDATYSEIKNDVIYQIGAISAFLQDTKLQHVKPHGALYNQALVNEDTAKAICDALLYVNPDLILVLLSGSKWAEIAKSMGIKVGLEVFADRAVEPDGTLVSRSKEGSVIHDADMVVERSIKMIKDGKVEAIDGSIIEYEADTICLHGDTPGAVEMAKKLNTEFGNQGIEITKLKQIINE